MIEKPEGPRVEDWFSERSKNASSDFGKKAKAYETIRKQLVAILDTEAECEDGYEMQALKVEKEALLFNLRNAEIEARKALSFLLANVDKDRSAELDRLTKEANSETVRFKCQLQKMDLTMRQIAAVYANGEVKNESLKQFGKLQASKETYADFRRANKRRLNVLCKELGISDVHSAKPGELSAGSVMESEDAMMIEQE